MHLIQPYHEFFLSVLRQNLFDVSVSSTPSAEMQEMIPDLCRDQIEVFVLGWNEEQKSRMQERGQLFRRTAVEKEWRTTLDYSCKSAGLELNTLGIPGKVCRQCQLNVNSLLSRTIVQRLS
jgi:hypothetical protein